MTVEAYFCVTVSRDKCLAEPEIETAFDAYREALVANDEYYGAITIRSENNPDVVIDDEVWATVQNLCFGAAVDLLAGKPVSVPYFRYGGNLELTVEGDEVVLASEFIPTVRIPRRELLRALYACGLRYIAFLRRLGQGDANFFITADTLTRLAEAAGKTIAEVA